MNLDNDKSQAEQISEMDHESCCTASSDHSHHEEVWQDECCGGAEFETFTCTEVLAEEPAVYQEKEPSNTAALEEFLNQVNKHENPETKLQVSLEFMTNSLAQTGTPNFRIFWEAKRYCLNLFKENIPSAVRSHLWSRYTELSNESRRLRDILDEQSSFAVEQIEIAIKALETEMTQLPFLLERFPNIDIPPAAKSLEKKLTFYHAIQKELNLLNTQASRINALRKELIRTEMRLRPKNKLFQRLSLIGDTVFPRRKELIKELSIQFIADVDAFIAANFGDNKIPNSIFTFREEIKALQSTAKVLTLNTQAFTHTRSSLSECWDRIKRLEKERKRERLKQKTVFKQNTDTIEQKIQEFNQAFSTLTIPEANQQINQIVDLMRSMELGRDEITFLRNELNKSRKLVLDKVKVQEQDRLSHEEIKERERKDKASVVRKRAETLLANVESLSIENIEEEKNALSSELLSLTKHEKQEIESLLKPLKDLITDKKERSLLNLSADDQQSLQQLKEILKQRKERRQEIKIQLEIYRKGRGSSGFDIEKAMAFNEQFNSEKERLEKINQGITEIEEKIEELESKV